MSFRIIYSISLPYPINLYQARNILIYLAIHIDIDHLVLIKLILSHGLFQIWYRSTIFLTYYFLLLIQK
jgi:hypothetical protein